MHKSSNIICVASTSWDTKFVQSTVQLHSLFALHNKVLFVDYAFTWADVIRSLVKNTGLRLKAVLGIESRIREVVTEYNTKLYILSLPPILPINWVKKGAIFNYLNRINYKITIKSILKAQKKLQLEKPFLINSWNPIFGINYNKELNEKLHVYYCYDEISAAKWISKHGTRLENLYIPKVDLVITSSRSLQQAKQVYNSRCFVVLNGVNFNMYQLQNNIEFDQNLIDKGQYKEIVGYIGAIDSRFDWELLRYVFEKLPNYLFIFIGNIADSEIKILLSEYSNIQFLPNKPAVELPKYVAEFSACIIPFVKNKFTANVYPMKINEYLALGKPVVLTDFNDLAEFESICSITSTKNQFVAAIEHEIETDSAEKKKTRMNMAFENSWEKRAALFEKIMNDLS